MNAVILGGTKGMGRAVARRLVERGDRVFLLGRQPEELDVSRRQLSRQVAADEAADAGNQSAHIAAQEPPIRCCQ